jgi:signal transduction histidine kinase
VADTGIGIATEYQDKLFEKGFVLRDSLNHHSSNTLEFKSAGLGLGLSIARGIVEAHGGTICVESQPGEGSVFTIRLKPERVMELMEAA